MLRNRQVRVAVRCIPFLLAACAGMSCGGRSGVAGPGASALDDGAQSLLLMPVTPDCRLADSSTLFLPDGRWESTTRTPVGDGTYLGHMTDGRIDPDEARRLFSGVEQAARTSALVAWEPSGPPVPAHLCGRDVLVVGGPDGSSWVAGDAAAVEAFAPWIGQLELALRRPPG
jgi:hypothetical protein